MTRREWTHVGLLLLAGLIARVFLFDWVGVWGDYGFYLYDSRLILQGQAPFIDFLGRSPLFNYAYAYARGVFGHPLDLLRWFINFWWLLAAMPVYLATREIDGHRTGLVAIAVFLLTPFALTYGMWANTQAIAAFFTVSAVCVLVFRERPAWYGVSGGLVGVAYLSRRSAIVVLGAIGLYALYGVLRDHTPIASRASLKALTTRGMALVGSFAGVLTVGYLLHANWDVGTAYALFEVHTVNLFISYGRGGYPLIGTSAPPVLNEISRGRIPIFNDICQLCGAWTARTFAKTIIISSPVVGILWYYIHDFTRSYHSAASRQYFYGILVALGLYAAVVATLAGYHLRAGTVLALGLLGFVTYRTTPISRETLYERRTVLVLLVLAGLTAGYLYRNRVLHTYYFMDFWPFLAIVTAILFIRAWDNSDVQLRTVLIGGLALAVITSGGAAYPVTNIVLNDNEAGWFTMDNLHDYQDDLNERTDPGDVIFTGSPSYAAGSHARLLDDMPRAHMIAVRYKDRGPAVPLYQSLIAGLESGHIKFVILDHVTGKMFLWNETAKTAFTENYCRVPDADSLYQETGAFLFEYNPDCPDERRPRYDQTQSSWVAGEGKTV